MTGSAAMSRVSSVFIGAVIAVLSLSGVATSDPSPTTLRMRSRHAAKAKAKAKRLAQTPPADQPSDPQQSEQVDTPSDTPTADAPPTDNGTSPGARATETTVPTVSGQPVNTETISDAELAKAAEEEEHGNDLRCRAREGGRGGSGEG
jgi:hypothetical protein